MSSTRPLGRMLVSKAKNKTISIDIDKVSTGSFFTTAPAWLTPQIEQFLEKALAESKGLVLDPFAGDGHLLETVKQNSKLKNKIVKALGFDIQPGPFTLNDSLLEIPNPKGAVILTNPPYLANHSAKRKGIDSLVAKYFEASTRNNLYQIALDKCLESASFVVAIIPETFLLSSFPKDRLELAVVIQDELFGDTDAPAMVACFGKGENQKSEVFTGSKKIGELSKILALRNSRTASTTKIVFNEPKGRIGLRAVDGSDGKSPIEFVRAKEFDYSTARVLVSSRLMTYLEIPEISEREIPKVISVANLELARIRKASSDLVLAPFKGNDKSGRRRRRLDYLLARRILNLAVEKTSKNS